MRAWLAAAGSMLALCAGAAMSCATGGPTEITSDGGRDASSRDATTGDSNNCPTGRTGPGCTQCAGGFHLCVTSCVQDQPNTPDAGCSLGCDTPCPTTPNGIAKCTSEGRCDIACDTSFQTSDGGCLCPADTRDCNGTCQQCCTDTDCPNHEACAGGACAGCQDGWGDCNGIASDGCETHLNSTSNCGYCGTSCCGYLCGCGFLGLGGENCNASGNSYACGC